MWLVGKALLCADLAVQNIVKSAGVGQCPSKMELNIHPEFVFTFKGNMQELK